MGVYIWVMLTVSMFYQCARLIKLFELIASALVLGLMCSDSGAQTQVLWLVIRAGIVKESEQKYRRHQFLPGKSSVLLQRVRLRLRLWGVENDFHAMCN